MSRFLQVCDNLVESSNKATRQADCFFVFLIKKFFLSALWGRWDLGSPTRD